MHALFDISWVWIARWLLLLMIPTCFLCSSLWPTRTWRMNGHILPYCLCISFTSFNDLWSYLPVLSDSWSYSHSINGYFQFHPSLKFRDSHSGLDKLRCRASYSQVLTNPRRQMWTAILFPIMFSTATRTLFCRTFTTRSVDGFTGAVGNTPLVGPVSVWYRHCISLLLQIYLKGLSRKTGSHIYGKAEFQNPGGSVKDRAALAVVQNAEANGRQVQWKGNMPLFLIILFLV